MLVVAMSQTGRYRIGRHARRKAKKHIWLSILVVILLLLGSAGFVVYRIVQDTAETEITLPGPITREYAPPDNADKVLDQDVFTIKLPEDWRLKDHTDTGNLNKYHFQATAKGKDNRTLEVYVDRVPIHKAFNRLLPVIIADNRVTVISSVSDNCTAFTGEQGANKPSDGPSEMDAKWQNISFTCDMANYIRNVVGVGTAENGHNLKLNGPKTGEHIFYFVYIDHNINPDYQILERAVESLTVK